MRVPRFPRRGAYTGRLSFDPYTEFHTDPAGRRVVTTDGGKTWRYAKRGDTSHNARYQKRVLVVSATSQADPHHFDVQFGDAHFDGQTFHTDADAPTVTSHAKAWQ